MKYVGAFLVALTGCGTALGLVAVWLTHPSPQTTPLTEEVLIGSLILAGLSIIVAGVIAEVISWDGDKTA